MAIANHACSFLFNTSGSGKTKLTLDGLCHHWGIYITCRPGTSAAIGSNDFKVATRILTEFSTWDPNNQNFRDNAAAADRAFAMLLCARVFVFKQFLDRIPLHTNAKAARRRWVLLQTLPGRIWPGDDIFSEVLEALRPADTNIMRGLVRTMLRAAIREDLFPTGPRSNPSLFLVIDEAQVAARGFTESFHSHIRETDTRPILHAMYRFLQDTSIFRGTIVVGTGLSTDMVKWGIGSLSAKPMGERQKPIVFTDVGLFHADPSQDAYIRRYLAFSDNHVSDRRLMERIQYWFSGRSVHYSILLFIADAQVIDPVLPLA
jgi:hypothetical protein